RAALAHIGARDCPNSHPHWFEQGALVDWLRKEPERWRHLAVLPPRVMNSTPARGAYADLHLRPSRYRRGAFIIHFWPLARDVTQVARAVRHYYRLSSASEGGALARVGKFAGAVGVRRPAGAS